MLTSSDQEHVNCAVEWRARHAAVMAPCYTWYSDLVVERAEGAHLFTADGRDILDFGSGISVTNLGHQHPAVVGAVRAQLERLWHTSVTALNEPAIRAAEALVGIAPPGLDQVFFCNSGAESVEAAIKLSRKATGRTDIIGFEGGFHGRTYGALSVTTSQRRFRAGVGPFLPGIHTIAYPSGTLAQSESEMGRLFATRLDPRDAAAILVEPMLGEGGYIVPPPELLPWLRRLCDEHGILLIADEVQTGLGRCGRTFAVEYAGVAPDILCVAKALGNGLPIAAIVAGHGLMGVWEAGDHGSTFAGNALACAAAEAVIETLQRENLAARAACLGARALHRIEEWKASIPIIREVRGLGLMIGVELGDPDPVAGAKLAAEVRKRALERGLLLLSCGTFGNVLRVIPPLTIPEEDLVAGLGILEECLQETASAVH